MNSAGSASGIWPCMPKASSVLSRRNRERINLPDDRDRLSWDSITSRQLKNNPKTSFTHQFHEQCVSNNPIFYISQMLRLATSVDVEFVWPSGSRAGWHCRRPNFSLVFSTCATTKTPHFIARRKLFLHSKHDEFRSTPRPNRFSAQAVVRESLPCLFWVVHLGACGTAGDIPFDSAGGISN